MIFVAGLLFGFGILMLILAPKILKLDQEKYIKFLKMTGIITVIGLFLMLFVIVMSNPEIAEKKTIIKYNPKYINDYRLNISDALFVDTGFGSSSSSSSSYSSPSS